MHWLFVTRSSLNFAVPILRIVTFLLAKGDEVTVVNRESKFGNPADSFARPLREGSKFEMHLLPSISDHGGNLINYLITYWADLREISGTVDRIVNDDKIDVIVLYNPDTLPLFWMTKICNRTTVVYYSAELLNFTQQPQYYSFEFLLAKRSDIVICCEETRARIMRKRLGLRATPSVLINSPPDVHPRRTGRLRRQLGLRAEDIVIIYQGAIAPVRCSFEIALAVSKLPEHVKLVFIGHVGRYVPQSYIDNIRKSTLKMRSSRRIFFLERVPYWELFDYTVDADIGCLFYKNIDRNHYYCAPNKLSEYAMSGVCVVGSDFPGLRKEIVGKDIGLVADPYSAESIYEKLNVLINDEKLLRQYQRRARVVYEKHYDYNLVVRPIIAEIEQVAAQKLC